MLEKNELDSVIPLHNYFKLRDHPSLNESESPFTPIHTALKIVKEHLRCLVNRQQDLPTSSYDVVIISHIINKTRKDMYFGSITSGLRAHGYKVLVCYLNHTKYHFSPQTDEVILPKSLGIKGDYEAIRELLKLKTFKKNHQYAHSLFSFPNFYNQILRIYFNQLFNKIKYKLVVCTYEGHPWERIVFGESYKANKDALRAAYTAAPLFPDQVSMHLDLTKKYNPDVWFMSGSGQENQPSQDSILHSCSKVVVGSMRSSLPSSTRVISDKKTLLIAPESFDREELILFNLALDAAREYSEYYVIYRFHPASSGKNLHEFVNKSRALNNMSISSGKTLEEDLIRSQYLIYRGSSVAIQSVAYGVIPIYYQYENDVSIDPFWTIDDVKSVISHASELQNIFKSTDSKYLSNTSIPRTKKLFEQLNVNGITKFL